MTVPPDPDTTISAFCAEWIRRANEGEPLDDPATFEAMCRVVAAAERRRQAQIAWDEVNVPDIQFADAWTACQYAYGEAVRDEDAALDALAARLRGEG